MLNALDVSQIRLPVANFDPMHPQVHQLLLQSLDKSTMTITPLANVGMNGGVWILSDPQKRWADLVLKSRLPEEDISPQHLAEPKHYMKLYSEHPALANDPSVVFPSKIVGCFSPTGEKLTDLIVMRKAPGTTLGTFITEKYHEGPQGRKELYAMFEHLGQVTRQFHDNYGKQHTDFQTANIMVDKTDNNRITFIDLGGMGQRVADNDLQHLQETLQIISDSYPPATYLELGYHHFEKGYYSKASQASMPQVSQQSQAPPGYQATPGYQVPPSYQAPQGGQAPPTSPQGDENRIRIVKAHGEKLGLGLVNRDGASIVNSIRGGLAELWNSQNPTAKIKSGQRLLEVNARRGYEQILAAVSGIEKGDHVQIWSQSQRAWQTDGFVLLVDEHSIDVEYQGGSLQKTLPLGSPELLKVLDLTFIDTAGDTMPSAFRFNLKLDGKKLGLQLVNRKGLAFVKKVVGGAVGDWNDQQPDFQIMPGDQIIEINGRRDSYQEFLSLCKNNNELEIVVRRPLVV